MMEGEGGASITDVRACDGKRHSVFRSYVFPYMDRPNLTVLTHALVTRLTFEDERATGVGISYTGSTHHIGAELEHFIRDAAVTYWHQTCTAKMGRDLMSVVDGKLRVNGVENLR